MDFIKFVINRNKKLILVSLISIVIYVSYESTIGLEEWFKGADILYKLISQISLAIVTGFAFYVTQSELARYNDTIEGREKIKPNVENVVKDIENYIKNLYVYTLERTCFINELKEEDFKLIIEKIDLDSKTCIFNNEGNNITVKEYIILHKREISKQIGDLYMYMYESMDTEVKDIFTSIRGCKYFEEISMLENTKLGCQNSIIVPSKGNGTEAAFIIINIDYNHMYEYYKLCMKLKEIVV